MPAAAERGAAPCSRHAACGRCIHAASRHATGTPCPGGAAACNRPFNSACRCGKPRPQLAQGVQRCAVGSWLAGGKQVCPGPGMQCPRGHGRHAVQRHTGASGTVLGPQSAQGGVQSACRQVWGAPCPQPRDAGGAGGMQVACRWGVPCPQWAQGGAAPCSRHAGGAHRHADGMQVGCTESSDGATKLTKCSLFLRTSGG